MGKRIIAPLRKFQRAVTGHGRFCALLLLGMGLLLTAACTTAAPPPQFAPTAQEVTLTADGRTRTLTTDARNVRQFLEEIDLEPAETDEVTPPLFTPLTDGMSIRIVRVTESIEIIERSIPFERTIVRSETMAENDPPRILQPGRSGLEELTVRIVYRDGLEAERRVTQRNTVTAGQDEIVMIGLGIAPAENVAFSGKIAFINGGRAVLLDGASAYPTPLETGGPLDPRVFSLSPTGDYLLFTRTTTDTATYNDLWVVETDSPTAVPRPLGAENVLWADWNPAVPPDRPPQIAYTTGEATELPPGWEANNDLWVGALEINDNFDPADVESDEDDEGEAIIFEPERLVDSYPATYGWWGGNYAWAPTGDRIGYSYADEVGVIDLAAAAEVDPQTTDQRQTLHRFREYDTSADWVWVPTLTWSPDGRYLAFTRHETAEAATGRNLFDTWAVDANAGIGGPFADTVGIWSHARWSPADTADAPIAYLQATDPNDPLRSTYTLWLMDNDGSNPRQIYPPPGENSYFPREEQFMAWAANGRDLAFVFDDDLYLHNTADGQTFRLTQDDAVAGHPTWAPYGRAYELALSAPLTTTSGITGTTSFTDTVPVAQPLPDEDDRDPELPGE